MILTVQGAEGTPQFWQFFCVSKTDSFTRELVKVLGITRIRNS